MYQMCALFHVEQRFCFAFHTHCDILLARDASPKAALDLVDHPTTTAESISF